MKKLKAVCFFIFASFYIITILSGCAEEQFISPLLIPYSNGAYILSEGTNPSNSKLSYYSLTNDTFYQSIYSGSLAYPDGILLHEDKLFIAEQGPVFGGQGKLYSLDTNGSLLFSSSPFGSSPYSIALTGVKVYVTNGPGSSVSVLNINGLSYIKDIQVGVYPQEILFASGKILVCNTSAFNGAADSTVSVINPSTDSVINKVYLRKDPTSIISAVHDNSLEIFAGCQGGGGVIYRLESISLDKLDSFFIPSGFDKDMVYHNGFIYFISGANNIDRLNLTDRTVTTVILNSGNPMYIYGYNFDIINQTHYVLDARNFQVNGSLLIYSQSGTLEKTYTTGVGPRRVVFKTGTTTGGS